MKYHIRKIDGEWTIYKGDNPSIFQLVAGRCDSFGTALKIVRHICTAPEGVPHGS